MKTLTITLVTLLLIVSTTACLRTRAQLKDDSEEREASKAVPTKVQDVHPQGEYVIDEIKSEITRMNGRIEDLERSQKQASSTATSANKEELKKLETRIIELEQAQASMLEAIKKAQETAPVADSKELFDKGKQQFDSGSLDEAIETFTTYLKHPKAKMAEKATFLRAEAFFKLKQYKKAIVDYSKFPEKFTTSHYMSTALFKIGQSFDALGMKDDAKSFYQELVEKFPRSPEAKKAKAKLK